MTFATFVAIIVEYAISEREFRAAVGGVGGGLRSDVETLNRLIYRRGNKEQVGALRHATRHTLKNAGKKRNKSKYACMSSHHCMFGCDSVSTICHAFHVVSTIVSIKSTYSAAPRLTWLW